jgi:hypothetical protein
MQLKKLPVGISSFRKIREEECVYVDKTKRILELVKSGDYFFLARPRRFGKSLLLDTLDHLFRGDKELFEGLYIFDKWKWEEKYPVIRLSVSRNASTTKKLETSLIRMLSDIADDYKIELKADEPDDLFTELIKSLYRKINQKVVILIDEYDKPVLDRLDAMRETEASKANKAILSNFYSALKDNPDYIHFVFLTGVTRFSGLSVFSGLNNLTDLTLDEKFGDICGYTQKELEENFRPHIKALAEKENMNSAEMLAKIKYWYDGYTWDGKTEMYNPFSTLNLFFQNKFNIYWFMSGPPNYLISYIKQAKELDLFFTKEEASETSLMNFNPDAEADTTAVPLLFQTGYLTIKGKIVRDGADRYIIDSPNWEVKQSLGEHILLSYVNSIKSGKIVGLSSQFLKAAIDEDADAFSKIILQALIQIPYTINKTKGKEWDGESFYHAILVCIMAAMGFNVHAEELTNLGRIDIVWEHENKVFIIELKFVDAYRLKKNTKTGRRTKTKKAPAALAKEMNKSLDEAISQIKDKKYYESYLLQKKEIILAGLAVSTKAQDVKAKFERL